jgi:phosphoglycolate phosphatase
MSRFDVFLFDYDGTLAATRNAVVKCLSRTLAERAADVSVTQIEAVIASGVPLEEAFPALVPALAQADIDVCVHRYRALYPDIDREASVLFDHVAATLTTLRRDGRKIVVLSNKGRGAIEASIGRLSLHDKVDFILPADPGEPVKPNPEAFSRRVQPLFESVPSSRFLMVGDTSADIAFAKAAGIASCWASYGYGDAAQCQSMKPDFIIHAFADLLSVLADAE